VFNIAQIRWCQGGNLAVTMDTIPELLSTVRLINRDDVYLVVDLNHGRKVVEVVSITGTLQVIPDVPVSGIKELVEGPPIYL
jgi:hypothetical protein